MTDFEIKMLAGDEVGISALRELAQKIRRISAGQLLGLIGSIASVMPSQDSVAQSSVNTVLPKVTVGSSTATAATSSGADSQAEITAPVPPQTGDALTDLVANSCERPLLSKTRQAFYVDPVHGDMKNDGSMAHPWDTLTNVLAQKMSVINGGDVVYLLNGNHGHVVASNVNTDFVEVMPAPGQTPVLASLTVHGAKWLFTGLRIQGLAGSIRSGKLVSIGSAWNVPITSNIIIANNIINSQEDTSGWTKEQWLQNAAGGIFIDGRGGTNCITITANTMTGVRGGAGIWADQSLFAYNKIDHYADDAVDYGGNNLTLASNTITNVIDIGDGIHLDCFQGFQPGGNGYDAKSFTNVTIDSNMCIRQTDKDLKFATYFQGIDNFSFSKLDWYNIKVINNVVITNHPHGITFGNIHNALISNNTVLADGLATTSEYMTATGKVQATAGGGVSWITVTAPSDHVVVRQNIAQTLAQGTGTDPTVIFENNISSLQVALFSNGRMEYHNSPGTYGRGNVLSHQLNAGFAVFDPAHYAYDLRLAPGSVANGYGSTLPVLINTTK